MGQSFFGVNSRSLSLVQRQTPGIFGERSIPVVRVLSTFCKGAADSLSCMASGLMEEIPLSPYSVSPGAVTVYVT